MAAIAVSIALGIHAHADTYNTFQTTRYYSANNLYFVKVAPNKRATLYRKSQHMQRIWSQILPELPTRLFISNDGKRVVMVDHYYGNGGSATAKVIRFFDEHGSQIANYSLGEIANLSRVLHTTSSAHWYYGAFFSSDQSIFIVETIVLKCKLPTLNVQSQADVEAYEECRKAQLYEELRFSIVNGKLVSRADIRLKYDDPEKRLLHELDLVESEHPPDNLRLVYALLELAHFYEGQSQYARATSFYERAIPIYIKTFSAGDSSVAKAVGEAATNYRNLGDDGRAEKLYRQALTALDKNQGEPESAYPAAIRIYEEYAVLLRELQRGEEARRMEARAKVLRSEYPDYKD